MSNRTTAISKTIEYDTDICIHCNDEVFVDEQTENVDRLPEGINVVVGGGEHISTETTPSTARTKSYRVPRVIVKWFGGNEDGEMISTQYMCLSCAEAVYGFGTGT